MERGREGGRGGRRKREGRRKIEMREGGRWKGEEGDICSDFHKQH